METLIFVIVTVYIATATVMNLSYFKSLLDTREYIKQASLRNRPKISRKVSMLILIPVLREQNIIAETIAYFRQLDLENITLHLCIAGTKREYATLEQYGFKKSTRQVVEETCATMKETAGFTVDFFEAEDYDGGDRATQLNHAAGYALKKYEDTDVIGVYDADSRPTPDTLMEVAEKYLINPEASYQQPAFFLKAANKMTQEGENPILIANALYQNTWSVISEIPMWIDYTKSRGRGKGNFYCIGHGEFFPKKIYEMYKFPEHEVTDGIQIGYRLSMSGQQVEILSNYCNDDVPHQLTTLIKQHKRWFGGCMRLMQAYNWCRDNNHEHKISTVLAGYWSQFQWAFAANLFLFNALLSIIYALLSGTTTLMILMLVTGVTYCYLLPIIATYLTPIEPHVSKSAFAALPLAIFIKGIGPNLYILNCLLKRKNKYEKVER